MISAFDLMLLGSLVSAGGLVFLRQPEWLHLGRHSHHPVSTPERRDGLERAVRIAGTRWLTVGALSLYVAYVHGAEDGYLFGPWSDVIFHVTFVSTAWAVTAFRIKQSAERPPRHPNNHPLSQVSLSE